MKYLPIFCLLSFLILQGCDQEKRNPMEGCWNLVSMKYVNDSDHMDFPARIGGSDMKIWSKDHFIFVGKFELDTGIMNSYGGGTYTLDVNRYTEKILYHTNPDYVGQKMEMMLEIRNDTLIQTWPVTAEGQVDRERHSIEKYVRF